MRNIIIDTRGPVPIIHINGQFAVERRAFAPAHLACMRTARRTHQALMQSWVEACCLKYAAIARPHSVVAIPVPRITTV